MIPFGSYFFFLLLVFLFAFFLVAVLLTSSQCCFECDFPKKFGGPVYNAYARICVIQEDGEYSVHIRI